MISTRSTDQGGPQRPVHRFRLACQAAVPAPRSGYASATSVVAVACLAMAGCGVRETGPQQVAEQLSGAVARGDGSAACALLAPPTRHELEQSSGSACSEAILEEGLPQPGAVDRTSVFGSMSQVGFVHDTFFLSRYPAGWRVLAAGCSAGARSEAPYDCELRGD